MRGQICGAMAATAAFLAACSDANATTMSDLVQEGYKAINLEVSGEYVLMIYEKPGNFQWVCSISQQELLWGTPKKSNCRLLN